MEIHEISAEEAEKVFLHHKYKYGETIKYRCLIIGFGLYGTLAIKLCGKEIILREPNDDEFVLKNWAVDEPDETEHPLMVVELHIVVNKKENPLSAAMETVENLVKTIRLFSLNAAQNIGSIFTDYQDVGESVEAYFYAPWLFPHPSYDYVLDKNGLQAFRRFLELIYPYIQENAFSEGLKLVHSIYSDALYESLFDDDNSIIYEKRIMLAISCLEGIYLRNLGSDSGLSFRLQMRLAKLFDDEYIARAIKIAYSIRSNFVHGNKLIGEQEMRKIKRLFKALPARSSAIELLTTSMLQYARLSILIAINMERETKGSKEKLSDMYKKFIESLDTLLLSPDNRAAIKSIDECLCSVKEFIKLTGPTDMYRKRALY
jgi:hypothetical protein